MIYEHTVTLSSTKRPQRILERIQSTSTVRYTLENPEYTLDVM